MFNNFDHFKKATLSLFESSKAQKLNLSQFREKFVTLLGFENLSALKASFEKDNTELFLSFIMLMIQLIIKKILLIMKKGTKKQKNYLQTK